MTYERMKGRDGSLWLRNLDTFRVIQVRGPGGVEIPEPKEPKPKRESWARDPERMLGKLNTGKAIAAQLAEHVATNRAKRKPRPARTNPTGDLFE